MGFVTMTLGLALLAAVSAGEPMLDPPDVQEVFRLRRELGLSSRQIAKRLGLARNTVKRYLRLGKYQPYTRRPGPDPLGEFRAWAEQRFLEVAGNVRVVHRELIEKKLAIGYSTLTQALRPLRERLAAQERATTRFETAPGQQMQADFGELVVPIAGVPTQVHFCVLTLGYSRRCFVRAFLSERQDQWLSAMEAGFHHFGGVPHQVLVDNAKALVQDRDDAAGLVYFTERFLAFCRHHGTAPRACRPFRARTKGKVESGVKYLKYNALAGQSFESFAALEAYLEKWTREVADVRVHGTTFERPIDRFESERAALLPLRTVPARMAPLSRKVSSDCLVNVATNRYSVPATLVGRVVQVQVTDGMVAISYGGQEVVRHRESEGRHRCIVAPEHRLAALPRRPVPVEPEPPPADEVLAPYAALLGGER